MREIILNGELMLSEEALYQHLQRAFSFPDYFGHNLDALWDVLNEVNEPTLIKFYYPQAARKLLGSYGARFIQLLKLVEKHNTNYTIEFIGK